MNAGLLEKKIIGGLALEQWYPELGPGAGSVEVVVRDRGDDAGADGRSVAMRGFSYRL